MLEQHSMRQMQTEAQKESHSTSKTRVKGGFKRESYRPRAQGPKRTLVVSSVYLVGVLLLFALFLLGPNADAAQVDFEEFDAYVERVMADWEVPGAAVAVIKDGEVIYVKGYGLRNREEGLSVTKETIFGIGSATKAFTTTAFQMLVEEGVLDWDTPVREYLPGFEVRDVFASNRMTPRDLALHRTGLAQADVPFLFHPDLDVKAFIDNLEHLEQVADFRTEWAYNNLGYILLGEIMEEVTGKPWEAIIQERIAAPLGMDATSYAVEEMKESADFAYAYGTVDGEVKRLPLTEIGAAAPAGAINANVLDMAKWVKLQLDRGAVGEKQLVSLPGIAELHTPQITIPSAPEDDTVLNSSYALGWFVETYRGHLHINHGGSTGGHSSLVSFLPYDDAGVVVLSNAGSPLPVIVARRAYDLLLGLKPIDWAARIKREVQAHQASEAQDGGPSEVGEATDGDGSSEAFGAGEAAPPPTHPLEDYAGTYEHPLYGVIEVDLGERGLVATYYTAEILLTHRRYDLFAGPLDEKWPVPMPFHFRMNEKGEIAELTSDLEGTSHPITFTRRPESRLSDPDFLEGLAGTYTMQGMPVEIALNGPTLRLVLPGQPAYTLVPDRGTRFYLKEHSGITVEFALDEAGSGADKIVINQLGVEFEAERAD